MREFFNQQRQWSYRTFGLPSERGPRGPLLHLEKEINEVLKLAGAIFSSAENFDRFAEELVDCQFLIFDVVHRSGISYDEFVEMCFAKLAKNKTRAWPHRDSDLPVEHDRSKD